MHRRVLYLVAIGMALTGLTRAQDLTDLTPGGAGDPRERLELDLESEPETTFELEAGTYTVIAQSAHFDATLRVEVPGHDPIQETEGWFGYTARVVFEVGDDAPVKITVSSESEETGPYSLILLEGTLEPVKGAPAHAYLAVYWKLRAQVLAARPDAEHQDVANAHFREGVHLYYLSNFDAAYEAYERGLKLGEVHEDDHTISMGHSNLGLIEYQRANYVEALRHMEIHQELLPEEDVKGRARAWGIIADIQGNLGRFEDHQSSLQKSLALAREAGDRLGEARVLGVIGEATLKRGEFEEAKEQFLAQREIFFELKNTRDVARSEERITRMYLERQDFAEAKPWCQKALERYRIIGDRHGLVRTLTQLATVEANEGLFHEAEVRYLEALEIAETINAPTAIGSVLLNLGQLRMDFGRTLAAREPLENALAMYRSIGARPGEVLALTVLSQLHYSARQTEPTLAMTEEARQLARELGDYISERRNLALQGECYLWRDDLDRVLQIADELEAMAAQADDLPFRVRALRLRADVFVARGQMAEADDLLDRCISLLENEPDRPLRSWLIGERAWHWCEVGRHEEALAAIEPLLENDHLMAQRVIGSKIRATRLRAALATGQLDLAESVLQEVDPEIQAVQKSEFILELPEHRSAYRVFGRLGQDLVAARLARLARLGDGESTDTDRITREGFQSAGLWKGRALLARLASRRGSADSRALDRALTESIEELDQAGRALATAVRAEAPAAERDQLNRVVETARARVESSREQLKTLAREDALSLAASPEHPGAALPEGGLWIEYVEGFDQTYAYVATATDIRFHRLGDRHEVEQMVATYLELIGNPRKLGSVVTIAQEGQRLFDRLLAPLLEGQGSKVLVIVPDGPLSNLPFDSLVIDTRSETPKSFEDVEFVIDRFEVSYVPSTAVAVDLIENPDSPHTRTLVLADPLYEGVTTSPSFRGGEQLPRLQRSRGEALAVARLLSGDENEELNELAESRSGELRQDQVELLLGENASVPRMQQSLEGVGILHLAAHGVVDLEDPDESAIVLSPTAGRAGAFRVHDIEELSLDARLVILSACETARGRSFSGEGVASLARAFIEAGARRVIASQWQVADWAASDTMQRFYQEHLKNGQPSHRALWLAKRSLRSRTGDLVSRGAGTIVGLNDPAPVPKLPEGHPFFWAPFIHVGRP